MGDPGNRSVGQDLAPTFILKVEGTKLEADITCFIQSVEYESSLDLIDLLKITIQNPAFVFDLGGPDFTTHKVFQPGNNVDLWIGYGGVANVKYIGRGIIDKHLPRYPENAIPSLEIKAFDAAKIMMAVKGEITSAMKPHMKGKFKNKYGGKFIQMTHSAMVKQIADKYGYASDIYPTVKVDTLIQKKKMSDYQFVRGLAALDNMEFWVDYDPSHKNWLLHWLPANLTQRPGYVLEYGTDTGAIFHCEAEYGLREQITDFQVMFFDTKKQEWARIDLNHQVPGADMTFTKQDMAESIQTPRASSTRKKPQRTASALRKQAQLSEAKRAYNYVNEELKNVESYRLSAGGSCIDIVPDRKFKNADEATDYARRWLQARKDHFIILKGECVGIETLGARQVHTVKGLGTRLSGAYYFTSVRHKVSADAQYRCEFTAHKVME
jgi:phage protein D